ncbi:patatin-like phospholipase family protein [Paludibacterium yongneupense]|uniref:patatin-like phospholipase family protein n=1 Tax=Paludibacterium yongneupense TaxID=400061 RepID=UPI000402676D|nr:patatin-like phospholipase family protein [Paludibacterium yongneupense]
MARSLALVLGGGAPNATLMAGALVAFIEREVSFDIISTAGAGALIGLLYCAPKSGNPVEALRSVVDMGVDDLIYQQLPVNFKVFCKPGSLAEGWRDLIAQNPILQQIQQQAADGPAQRLFADWTRLLLATLSPSDLNASSTGLCAHVPFIDSVVDFAALARIEPAFYMNAYNLSRHEMQVWDKQAIGKDQFLAALSFPFLYPPYEIDGEFFIEGAAIDTLNFKGLFQRHRHIDTVVVFDVLGCDRLLHPPTDLYDAWGQSIITPLTEIARDDLKLFESRHLIDPDTGKPRCELLRINYEHYLDARDYAQELDWSHSNLARLFDVGYEAGHHFCDEHALSS